MRAHEERGRMSEPVGLDCCGVARDTLKGPPTVETVVPRWRPHTMEEAGFSCVRCRVFRFGREGTPLRGQSAHSPLLC